MDQPEHTGQPGGGPSGAPEESAPTAPGDALAGGGNPGRADDAPEDPHTALPPKVEAWRKRSAAGAILTGFALGLQQALDTQRDDPSIVVQTSGDTPEDLPVEADFEYGRPRQSVVNIRPWLLNDRSSGRADEQAGGSS